MIIRAATFTESRGLMPKIIPASWRVEQEGPSGLFMSNPGLRATLVFSLVWYHGPINGPQAQELWRHVSLAIKDRTPTWKEMEEVRIWTCGSESVAYQVHAPRSEWINDNPYVLHLFSPVDDEHRLPDFRNEYEPGRFTL